jgi:hypothetical protein
MQQNTIVDKMEQKIYDTEDRKGEERTIIKEMERQSFDEYCLKGMTKYMKVSIFRS